MSRKIVSIVGARPQFIKAAAVSSALGLHGGFEEILVHTGQHFDPAMSTSLWTGFQLPAPNYHLGIHSMPRTAMIDAMQAALLPILQKEKPDWVLVFGDTNSTLAGALAAKACGIPLAHVEAGMRAQEANLPEEENRVRTDVLSTLRFCATATALENLEKEGLEGIFCGDVQYDLFAQMQAHWQRPAWAPETPFLLASIHRAANTVDARRLGELINALESLHEHIPVLLLVHPRLAKIEAKCHLSPPLPYLETQWLLAACNGVVTDSGGLQKEAFFHQKPCAVLRSDTEWRELTAAGFQRLCLPDAAQIMAALHEIEAAPLDWSAPFFGNGDAAQRIVAGF